MNADHDHSDEPCTDSRCDAQTHPRESDAIRSLVDSAKAQGKAERTIRDLRAEVERLTKDRDDWQRTATGARREYVETLDILERAEAALTSVREVRRKMRRESSAWTGTPYGHHAAEFASALDAALDPASDATRPTPASTGATGTRAGSAPSEGHSEAQGALADARVQVARVEDLIAGLANVTDWVHKDAVLAALKERP